MIDPTPISDYEHWNEEAAIVWYQEVGRFASTEPPDPDPYEEDWGWDPYDD